MNPPTHLIARESDAIAEAQALANFNGSPVAVLARDGWFAICAEPPDDMESEPLAHGWTEWALIDPTEPEE